jgi:hypothetical protein
MDLRKALNWLIAFAVAMGLLVAPLSAPAVAASHMAAAAQTQMSEDMQMAADMPCCPRKPDQKARDCGSCSFVALCMLTISMAPPSGGAALIERAFLLGAFALPDDLLIDGLGEHPPDQPPRTTV